MEEYIRNTSISPRDNYADFLKYYLIWLVVLGHLLSFCQYKAGFGSGLYCFIYSFHMPLFVFISGYFSKHTSYRQKNIDILIYPFVIFQLLTILYSKIIPYFSIKESFFYPNNQLWYLLALFWWRTFVPYRIYFKRNVVIITAFIICLGVGFSQDWNGFLGLLKTAYFLPFFILGVYCNDLYSFVEKLLHRKWLWIIVFVINTIVIFILCTNQQALHYVNYGFKASLGYGGDKYNIIARVIALVVSLIMCPAVLLLLKLMYDFVSSRFAVSCIGGGTMLAFLGHEFFRVPLMHLYSRFDSITNIILCIITSILITYILTRKKMVELLRPIMDLSALCNKIGLKIYSKQDKLKTINT